MRIEIIILSFLTFVVKILFIIARLEKRAVLIYQFHRYFISVILANITTNDRTLVTFLSRSEEAAAARSRR